MKRPFLVTAVVLASLAPARPLRAQALFREEKPLILSLTTNLKDLVRERDSTELEWFGAELAYTDAKGDLVKVPTELRARGHFRRQARNCSFPPLYIRAKKDARDSTILQGNPRLKIVTPCRPGGSEFQQYILLEYLLYRTYSVIDSVHHRTRLAQVTYRDSTDRVKPVEVTAFLMEVDEEVADEHGLTFVEETGARWADVQMETIARIGLWEYMIGNTDWSLGALHNIVLLRTANTEYRPVAYDFDWSGAVNARYAFPQARLGIRTVRDRLHRGPCRPAADWAPTVAYFQSKKAAVDSVWALPIEGLDARKRADTKAFLDQFWGVLADPKKFKREILDTCLPEGN